MTLTALSLFSGAGGLDIGVENAGFKVLAACELDKDACKTYRENHNDTMVFEGDINNHLDELYKYTNVDLLIGGPPCQGFSIAGKMNIDDPRSKLVFSYCDIVENIKPNAFIMENVKTLGTLSKFEHIRDEIIRRTSSYGYNVSMFVLNAKDFGVPQSRERVFFIGIKNTISGSIQDKEFNSYRKNIVTLREAIAHLGPPGSKNNPHITKAKITFAANPILRKSPYAGMLFNGQGRPLNADSYSSTLPASMGGNRTPIIDELNLYDGQKSWIEDYHQKLMNGEDVSSVSVPSRLRRLTIDEAKIIQTFPNDYKFIGSSSKVFMQIGNAVPCKLAEVVGSVVRNKLTNGKGIDLDVDEITDEDIPKQYALQY